MRVLLLATCLTAALCGCHRQDPMTLAREQGFLPPEVDPDAPVSKRKPGLDTRLGQMLALSAQYEGAELPPLPPPPRYEDIATGSSYTGWETDRIDASSFDNLTDSLNAILQKMGPVVGADFDKVFKYVLMQVPRDPLVARAAAGGGKMSDAQLLQAIQSYVHDRTPREVTELAEQMSQRQAAQQGSAKSRAMSGLVSGGIGGP